MSDQQKTPLADDRIWAKYFSYEDIPDSQQHIYSKFHDVACFVCSECNPGTAGRNDVLRKLLAARDATVHAKLQQSNESEGEPYE